MVHQTVQMDQMNPLQLVVHLPVPVIQTFVFKKDRRFSQVKTAETALIWNLTLMEPYPYLVNLVGVATVDIVCRSGRSVMVTKSVQMDQMNPPPVVVHLPAPVILTFVFHLDRRLDLDKTVETALIDMGILVGAAAALDSV